MGDSQGDGGNRDERAEEERRGFPGGEESLGVAGCDRDRGHTELTGGGYAHGDRHLEQGRDEADNDARQPQGDARGDGLGVEESWRRSMDKAMPSATPANMTQTPISSVSADMAKGIMRTMRISKA